MPVRPVRPARAARLAGLAGLLLALAAGGARAQLSLPRQNDRRDNENRASLGLKIARRTVSGLVKSLDPEKRLFVLTTGKGERARDVAVDVGPSLIKAGKGGATFADLHAGDKVSVWGEVTVHGGLRAMEITLPKERMSIPPPEKPKREKKSDEKKADSKKTEDKQPDEKQPGEKQPDEQKKR